MAHSTSNPLAKVRVFRPREHASVVLILVRVIVVLVLGLIAPLLLLSHVDKHHENGRESDNQ
jgi:hypothetical protein